MIIISLEETKSKLENLPGLDYKYVLMFKDLFEKNNVQNCLELMPGMGKSSAFIATLLKDNNCAGHLTTIDLRKSKNLKPNIEEIIHQLELDDVVTSYFERQSVNWGLMKLIKENSSPIYDFVLINGPGNWYETGFTFNLVDKLLKPGGIVIIDSLNWSYGSSPSLKNTDFVKKMDEDERESRQARLVYDLLVKTHTSYENFNIIDGRFGVAYKNDYNQVLDRLIKKESLSDSPEIIKLENEINKLKTFQRNTNRALHTYNEYFNVIFIDSELNAKGLLKKLQDLTIEQFSFLINIFDKYNLNWWNHAGNLLGSVRHGNFIPWDDDIDLGMMRKDYQKFIEVLPKELESKKLSNEMEIVFKHLEGKKGNCFLQLMIRPVINGKKVLLAGIDIFPYDFLVNYENFDDYGKLFDSVREEYLIKAENGPDSSSIYNGLNPDEIMSEIYNKLNFSYKPQRYIITGVDSGYAYKYTQNYARLKIIDTNTIFPLNTLRFGKLNVKVPNDTDDYLKIHYGNDYMKIPRYGEFHNRITYLRNIDNINEVYDDYIKLLKNINSNFK